MDDERDELTEAELDEWYRYANAATDPHANIGAQARNKKIRRLIEELRRERERWTKLGRVE